MFAANIRMKRREFLSTVLVYSGILGLSQVTNDPVLKLAAEQVKKWIKQTDQAVKILWLQGQTCSGDTIALLNAVDPSLVDVLLTQIQGLPPVEIPFHPTIMPQWGVEHLTGEAKGAAVEWDANEILIKAKEGEISPLLVIVEGSIASEEEAKAKGGFYCAIGEKDGKPILMEDYLKEVADKAAAMIAVGTCAAFGGIPAGRPNPTKAKGVIDVLGKNYKSALGLPVINIPGCPTTGDWQIKTYASLLLTVAGLLPAPELDDYNRPVFLYRQTTHELCSRGVYYASGKFIQKYGERYCVYSMGCKGPITYCPTNLTGFIEGTGFCTEYGAPCIGCTMPEFPDEPYAPFLKAMPAPTIPTKEALLLAAVLGLVAGGAAAYSAHKSKKKVVSESGGGK